MMSELVLQTDKNGFHSKVLRVLIGIFGLSYILFSLFHYLPAGETGSGLIRDLVIGISLLAGSLIKPRLGTGIQLELSDEYIKGIEQPSYIRTAYLKKVAEVELTAFTLKISYQSGSTERFRLPFLNSRDYEMLKQRLMDMSGVHGFRFKQKSWKLF